MTGRTTRYLRPASRIARTASSLTVPMAPRRVVAQTEGRMTQENPVTARFQGRMWRIGAALAPFVALAMSLEAGRRWF